MNRKRVIMAGVVLALLLGMGGPTRAQDEGEDHCSLAATDNFITNIMASIEEAKDMGLEERFERFRFVHRWVTGYLTLCTTDLDFEGTGSQVSDFVQVPVGLYRATLAIEPRSNARDQSVSVNFEVFEGQCASSEYGNRLFSYDHDGDQALFRSDGCVLIWIFDNPQGEQFAVTFEKMQ